MPKPSDFLAAWHKNHNDIETVSDRHFVIVVRDSERARGSSRKGAIVDSGTLCVSRNLIHIIKSTTTLWQK